MSCTKKPKELPEIARDQFNYVCRQISLMEELTHFISPAIPLRRRPCAETDLLLEKVQIIQEWLQELVERFVVQHGKTVASNDMGVVDANLPF